MSNSKKAWNASKAQRRAVDATKKTNKMKAQEAKDFQKKVVKGKV